MSREFAVLVECARLRWDSASASRIRDLLSQGVDWSHLLHRARLNRVLPLVHAGLSRLESDAVPRPVADELRRSYHASARNGIALTGHLLQALQWFAEEGIAVLPFKGPSLAVALYGDLGLRSFGDIDVLIDSREVDKVRGVLAKRGYREGWSHAEWEFHFDAPSGGHTIDVHHQIAPSHFPSPGSFHELWERRQPVTLLNTTIWTMGQEDLLFAMCVELVRDYHERKPRLVQVCDVAALLTRSPALDWPRILAHTRAIGCQRILLLDLLLASRLLGVLLPPAVTQALESDRKVEALARYAESRLRARVSPPTPTPSLDALFYLRSRERAADKLGYLHYRSWGRLRPLITPSEKDSRFLPLPQGLSFLHYLVRPIRVASDYLAARRFARKSVRQPAKVD